MTTSEYIKSSIKQYKPRTQRVNVYNANVGNTSTRLFKIDDEKGNMFKLHDFSDRIMIETTVKTSLLFAVNQPDKICLANKLIAANVYSDHSNDNLVLACLALIRNDIHDIKLMSGEALFVYRNSIQLLIDKGRELVTEIKLLRKIKLIIEEKFPDTFTTIDISKIPGDLHDLLPILKEWAIPDDYQRDEKIKKSSKSELQKVADMVKPKMNIINDYLDSFKGELIPYEATLIGNLGELVTELN